MSVKISFHDNSRMQLIEAANICRDAIKNGHRLFICGNGGSATDASHFSGEILGRFMRERDALPCIMLGGDLAATTAIANDYGYEHVFSRPLKALMTPNDVLIAISTSGNSKNVLNAVEVANQIGGKVIGLTGGNGGRLMQLSDVALNVSEGKNSARIQETHIWALHCIAELIEGK
jgi:D-sedoheptulose 7-phosphate isomerase